MTPDLVLCSTCKTEKPPADFYPDSKKTNGLRSSCKDCHEARKALKKKSSVMEQLIAVGEAPKLPMDKKARLTTAIELRMDYYRCGALDALYDLAMMPITDSSHLMQVKFMAASRLAGPTAGEAAQTNDGFDSILQTLNEKYHSMAPRIRSVRERIVEYETSPPALTVSDG